MASILAPSWKQLSSILLVLTLGCSRSAPQNGLDGSKTSSAPMTLELCRGKPMLVIIENQTLSVTRSLSSDRRTSLARWFVAIEELAHISGQRVRRVRLREQIRPGIQNA